MRFAEVGAVQLHNRNTRTFIASRNAHATRPVLRDQSAAAPVPSSAGASRGVIPLSLPLPSQRPRIPAATVGATAPLDGFTRGWPPAPPAAALRAILPRPPPAPSTSRPARGPRPAAPHADCVRHGVCGVTSPSCWSIFFLRSPPRRRPTSPRPPPNPTARPSNGARRQRRTSGPTSRDQFRQFETWGQFQAVFEWATSVMIFIAVGLVSRLCQQADALGVVTHDAVTMDC